MTPPLLDSRRKLKFGLPNTPAEAALVAAGATQIVRDNAGRMVGVYIDCETGSAPAGSATQIAQRDRIAAQMVSRNVGQVIVSTYPSETGKRIAGCICCLIWYPYHQGWGMPPKRQQGYVLQHSYAWPNDRPPTRLERLRLLTRVRLYRPRPALILLY